MDELGNHELLIFHLSACSEILNLRMKRLKAYANDTIIDYEGIKRDIDEYLNQKNIAEDELRRRGIKPEIVMSI